MKKFMAAAFLVLLCALPLEVRGEPDRSRGQNPPGQGRAPAVSSPPSSQNPVNSSDNKNGNAGPGDKSEDETEEPAAGAELVSSVMDAAGRDQGAGEIQFMTATGQPVAGEFIGGGSGFLEALFSTGLVASSTDTSKPVSRIAKPFFKRKPPDPSKPRIAGKVSILQDRTVVFSPTSRHQMRFRFESAPPAAGARALVVAEDGRTREAVESNLQFQEGEEAVFTNAVDGMDLSYRVQGNRLEEDVVLAHAPSISTFAFRLDFSNLKSTPQADGTVYFVDSGSQTPVLYLDKPFMVDHSGARSENVGLGLVRHDDHMDAQIQADAAWLQDPGRAYPVVIDPSIVYVQSPPDAGISSRTVMAAGARAVLTAGMQPLTANVQSAFGGTITVALPGNCLPPGTQVIVSANSNPPPATSNVGQAAFLVNPIAVDLNTDNGSQPNQPVTITMSFADSDLPPSLSKSSLKLAFFDAVSNGWVPLNPTSVDSANNTATARTSHFTTFALLGFAVQSAVDNAVIYPIPWKPGSGDSRFDAPQITFTNLPAGSSIKIYKLTGDLIKGAAADNSGTFLWDGTNNAGRAAAGGVYPVIFEGGGGRIRKRIVVIR